MSWCQSYHHGSLWFKNVVVHTHSDLFCIFDMQTGDVTQIMNTLQLSRIDFAICSRFSGYLLVCKVNTRSTRSLSQEQACHLLDNIAIVTNVTGH